MAGKAFVAEGRFSAADVYVGSQLDWGLQFGTIPTRPAFEAYVAPLRGAQDTGGPRTSTTG